MTAPERPISAFAEDELDLGNFVSRIAAAVISEDGKRGKGVVVGLVGPWGSGKSSVLNLIEGFVRERFPETVVLRFDPWLVSGREELISIFISELYKEVRNRSGRSGVDKAKQAADRLLEYAELVAPAGDAFINGAGTAAKGSISAVRKNLFGGTSIVAQRKKLEEATSLLDSPILVLIDELDRIDDHEIQSMAKLIKSIMDFPSISYVVAFDEKRVAEALGGEGVGGIERGQAYLEKIVQHQISIPYLFPEKIKSLVKAGLSALIASGEVTDLMIDEKRLGTLLDILVPRFISTMRDVKRVMGSFHVLASMVKGEVDLVDVLAFCALSAKAPRTVELIRSTPELYVVNSGIFNSHILVDDEDGENNKQDQWNGVIAKKERKKHIIELMKVLFPTLARIRGNTDDFPKDRILFRRPLLTLLRLGIIPGAYSRKEVEEILCLDEARLEGEFDRIDENNEWGHFLDRLEEMYCDCVGTDHKRFWRQLIRRTEKAVPSLDVRLNPKRDLLKRISEVFEEAVRTCVTLRNVAPDIIIDSMQSGCIHFPSKQLHEHYYCYGLFGYSTSSFRNNSYLSREQAVSLSCALGSDICGKLLHGSLLPMLHDPMPLYVAVTTGNWWDDCREWLESALDGDENVISLALLFYPNGAPSDLESVRKLCKVERLKSRCSEILDRGDRDAFHSAAFRALKGAAGHD